MTEKEMRRTECLVWNDLKNDGTRVKDLRCEKHDAEESQDFWIVGIPQTL